MTTAKNTIDLPKIIKRLELIKSLIALEEESEISTHLLKLKKFTTDLNLNEIVSFLEQKAYSLAMPAIENYINKRRQLLTYIDPEIEGLRLEAKSLEKELNKLSDEKADLEKIIHEFGVRHNRELGELILKILGYRKQKAKGTPKEQEAEDDFKEYSREYEITKDEQVNKLTEEEQKEIKKLYRKASKLCHPDVVNDDQKELADKLFRELNAAYERNDLQRVKEILENLEKGNFFVSKSDTITEKQLMKAEIEKMRMKINDLKAQLLNIKKSEAYTTISRIRDWDEYFSSTKEKLQEQVKELEIGRD